MTLSDHIAGEIRAGMARKQITAAELAAAVGMSTATFQRRMQDARRFNVDELTAISQHIDLAFASLFPGEVA